MVVMAWLIEICVKITKNLWKKVLYSSFEMVRNKKNHKILYNNSYLALTSTSCGFKVLTLSFTIWHALRKSVERVVAITFLKEAISFYVSLGFSRSFQSWKWDQSSWLERTFAFYFKIQCKHSTWSNFLYKILYEFV